MFLPRLTEATKSNKFYKGHTIKIKEWGFSMI